MMIVGLCMSASTVAPRKVNNSSPVPFIYIKPHEGEWERTYQALQKQARDMLQALAETGVKDAVESDR